MLKASMMGAGRVFYPLGHRFSLTGHKKDHTNQRCLQPSKSFPHNPHQRLASPLCDKWSPSKSLSKLLLEPSCEVRRSAHLLPPKPSFLWAGMWGRLHVLPTEVVMCQSRRTVSFVYFFLSLIWQLPVLLAVSQAFCKADAVALSHVIQTLSFCRTVNCSYPVILYETLFCIVKKNATEVGN